eukprot:CAMPEP_0180348844 /NCGR_PEP_ID=MMETSP0989-20121125/5150_1 /TAXON_ID=697907 /ORGANISM="non described non described, Strain CCMP2293" /LENGTH=153 /DNA_ID=CAMNT_0022338123 /DNA_START=201 /DNA_END=661 /DNA_ORIENTATION=+
METRLGCTTWRSRHVDPESAGLAAAPACPPQRVAGVKRATPRTAPAGSQPPLVARPFAHTGIRAPALPAAPRDLERGSVIFESLGASRPRMRLMGAAPRKEKSEEGEEFVWRRRERDAPEVTRELYPFPDTIRDDDPSPNVRAAAAAPCAPCA